MEVVIGMHLSEYIYETEKYIIQWLSHDTHITYLQWVSHDTQIL